MPSPPAVARRPRTEEKSRREFPRTSGARRRGSLPRADGCRWTSGVLQFSRTPTFPHQEPEAPPPPELPPPPENPPPPPRPPPKPPPPRPENIVESMNRARVGWVIRKISAPIATNAKKAICRGLACLGAGRCR